MNETVLRLIEQFGYATITILILAEGLGLPLPGEASLIIGGALAATTGRLTLEGVVFAAAAGAIAGAAGGYWIGASVSDRTLARWAARVGIGPARLERARELVRKHGARTALIGRFITLLRILVAVISGASRMPFGEFFLFSSIGAAIWAVAYGLLGYTFGDELPRLEHVLGRTTVIVTLVLVLGIAVLLTLRRHTRRTPK